MPIMRAADKAIWEMVTIRMASLLQAIIFKKKPNVILDLIKHVCVLLFYYKLLLAFIKLNWTTYLHKDRPASVKQRLQTPFTHATPNSEQQLSQGSPSKGQVLHAPVILSLVKYLLQTCN